MPSRRKIDVQATKPVQQTSVNSQTLTTLSWPLGRWRTAVRGFCASISRSAKRLNAIAALRANTMHKRMPANSIHENAFLLYHARMALKRAKGSAKSVVALVHQKLPNKSAADAMKKTWTEHLDRLTELLA